MLRALSLSFCTLFILVFISSSAFALPKCPDGDPKLWDQCSGVTDLADGRRYWGEFRRGVPEGKGKYLGSDGALYVGDIRAGIGEGNGVTTFKDGRVIEGLYKAGKPIGKVRITDRDQSVYFGDIENGLRSGSGKIVYVDGLLYTGSFREDKKNGRGILEYPSGDRYEGEFRDDEPTERGELKLWNGDLYRGTFLRHRPSGQGTLTFQSGLVFKGQFQDGVPLGYGELRSSSGDILEKGMFSGFDSIRLADAHHAKNGIGIKSLQNNNSVPGSNPKEPYAELKANAIKSAANDKIGSVESNVDDDFAIAAPGDQKSSPWPPLPPERTQLEKTQADNDQSLADAEENISPGTNPHLATSDNARSSSNENMVSNDVLPKIPDAKAQFDEHISSSRQKDGVQFDGSKPTSPPILLPPHHDSQELSSGKSFFGNLKRLGSDTLWITSDTSPLECRYGSDLFFKFINCIVTADSISVDDIVFNDGQCASGRDNLKTYDDVMRLSWTKVFSKLKAYYFYAPFDFRGMKKKGERIVFLDNDCKDLSKFNILSNGQSWIWMRPK